MEWPLTGFISRERTENNQWNLTCSPVKMRQKKVRKLMPLEPHFLQSGISVQLNLDDNISFFAKKKRDLGSI